MMKSTFAGWCAVGAMLLSGAWTLPAAGAEKSLLPDFGLEGESFTVNAKENHIIRGWLPMGWNDNSEWAAVGVTYTKLDDSPDKTLAAVRIKVEGTQEPWVQLTSFTGLRTFEKGRIYRVVGWLRSPDQAKVAVTARQAGEPYEPYHRKELPVETTWKQFEFEFAPNANIEALIMFTIESVATVDIAGVVVTDEGSAN